MHALGVEGIGSPLTIRAIRAWNGDFFSVEEKADGGGVADVGDDFMAGMNGSCGGCDKSFFGDELAVGEDRDPAIFVGTDDQRE